MTIAKDFNSFKAIYAKASDKRSNMATNQNYKSTVANQFTIIQVEKKTAPKEGVTRISGVTKATITFADLVGEHRREDNAGTEDQKSIFDCNKMTKAFESVILKLEEK